jgi:hypothetical protein
VKREDLAHILRAASQIADEHDVLVIGSQSILGTYSEDELPDAAVASVEADVTFFWDAEDKKSDLVDGALGEDSRFHSTFGYYAQGVSVSTAVLPSGWRDRLVVFENASTEPGRGFCLDRHDLVISKLVAGREKDFAFAAALIRAELVDADVLRQRADLLPSIPAVKRRVQDWINARAQLRTRQGPPEPPRQTRRVDPPGPKQQF